MALNKDSATSLLKRMLPDNPAIYFVANHEQIDSQRQKHSYRFFIINNTGDYNVSGAVTAAFGIKVIDRAQTFSVNQLSPEEDLKAFTQALQKFLGLPNLQLIDLIFNAKETLEFTIHPECLQFFPIAEEQTDNEEPGTPVDHALAAITKYEETHVP